jgi:glutathione peroxidase
VKSFIKPIATLLGLAMVSLVSSAALACPDYMKGEYRKLHSKDSVNICELMENKTVLVVNTNSKSWKRCIKSTKTKAWS